MCINRAYDVIENTPQIKFFCFILFLSTDKGVTGFSGMNFKANTDPLFTSKISFFTVLGVFFPAACGVMAGVNMSGDLKDPAKNIPVGSLAALAVT